MSGLSNTYAKAVANHFFRGDSEYTAQARPSTLYIALHRSSPSDVESSAGELEGGAYERQPISFDPPITELPSATPTNGELVYNTYISNNASIFFPRLPASEISHIGIWTDKYSGDLLFSDAIINTDATPVTAYILNTGDSLVVPENSIKIYIV